MSRILVGLSGGVDSAVTAHLLKGAGHQVEALYMFNWAEDEEAYCDAADDFAVAKIVCAELDIPLHRADFSSQYRARVFSHFLAEYQAGRTPSPDLLCNREIKFGEFLRYAQRLGAEQVATGHYARLVDPPEGRRLALAADPGKDQTYFLAAVPPAAFMQVLFPLGELRKTQVREIANTAGLPNHARKDSTGICFIGERPMREFLARYIHTEPGPIVDSSDNQIGQHQGLAFYTYGQRRGLGIGGVSGATEAPWYVLAKHAESNRLVVTQDRRHPGLHAARVLCSQVNWLFAPPAPAFSCQVRIRHRQGLTDALAEREGNRLSLRFREPQWAAAPGQYAVVYLGEHCLGSGVIDEIEHPAGRSVRE